MKQQLRMMTVAATALVAAASFAMTTQHASAQNWCRGYGGSTVGANYCYYYTKEQCEAAASGEGGTCALDPTVAAQATQPGEPSQAYAKYLPKPAHHKAKRAMH